MTSSCYFIAIRNDFCVQLDRELRRVSKAEFILQWGTFNSANFCHQGSLTGGAKYCNFLVLCGLMGMLSAKPSFNLLGVKRHSGMMPASASLLFRDVAGFTFP